MKEDKKKKKKRNLEQIELVKKKKKQPTRRRKEKKKSKVVKNCGWVLFVGPIYVFNYNIVIELWVMKTENKPNVFSVSITHNSKIRELSDRNRIMTSQTTFLLWVSPFLNYELWRLRYELWKLLNQIPPKLEPSNQSPHVTALPYRSKMQGMPGVLVGWAAPL